MSRGLGLCIPPAPQGVAIPGLPIGYPATYWSNRLRRIAQALSQPDTDCPQVEDGLAALVDRLLEAAGELERLDDLERAWDPQADPKETRPND